MCLAKTTESHITTATKENFTITTNMGDYSRQVYYCNLIISSQVPVVDNI